MMRRLVMEVYSLATGEGRKTRIVKWKDCSGELCFYCFVDKRDIYFSQCFTLYRLIYVCFQYTLPCGNLGAL